jgi:hypothetical protein
MSRSNPGYPVRQAALNDANSSALLMDWKHHEPAEDFRGYGRSIAKAVMDRIDLVHAKEVELIRNWVY